MLPRDVFLKLVPNNCISIHILQAHNQGCNQNTHKFAHQEVNSAEASRYLQLNVLLENYNIHSFAINIHRIITFSYKEETPQNESIKLPISIDPPSNATNTSTIKQTVQRTALSSRSLTGRQLTSQPKG